ncbi:hypothetical protein Q1695_012039 [Nippostrongylus brasiliensis]|nr:hypothetical protein Q1695_012039 [Nippostrongylus brasiliensis]
MLRRPRSWNSSQPYRQELPLVASPLGEVPVVDEQLPKDSERAILMRENDLRTIHETLLSTLNIIELVRKIGADDHGSDFPTAAVGYLDILGSIVSGSIMDIVVLRRERFLRSLAVNPKKAMPSYRRLPFAGSTMTICVRRYYTICVRRYYPSFSKRSCVTNSLPESQQSPNQFRN